MAKNTATKPKTMNTRARAFARLIPGCDKNIIYAEHFIMPNNICNFFLFPMSNKVILKKTKKANKKLDKVCNNIKKGIIRKRGWNIISTLLGKTQNIAYPKMEEQARHSFIAYSTCTQCGLCVELCPMENLEIINGKVVQKDNCTICYRCVNICPQKAATVYFRTKPKIQYEGIIS